MTDESGVPPQKDGQTVLVRNGRRIVQWSLSGPAGEELRLQHDFPDALQHHYRPAPIGDDVLLYDGPFRRDDDPDSFDGVVRWRWAGRPRIESIATRSVTLSELADLVAPRPSPFWVDPSELVVGLVDGVLPPQPSQDRCVTNAGHMVTLRVEQQLGDGDNLERVTFLIPNGWKANDGAAICDPEDLTHHWYGRLTAAGGGWAVTIDRTREMTGPRMNQMKDSGASCFTHVGCLTRTDGAPFSSEDAYYALDRVRLALGLALGRRTTCALPVGWRRDKPVWARWRSAQVDPPRSVSHWLDESIATRQVAQVLGLVLDVTDDPVAYETVRTAVSYYVAATTDVDVELSVAVPVSGMQLLAYYRFVTCGSYSKTQWAKLDTEEELRLLLDELNADLTIAPHFSHLAAVQARLASNASQRDALGVIMKMRNVVTHPARDTPASYSPYEWAEAGMHATYWLCLALLRIVGYDDDVAAVMGAETRWIGQVRATPWRVATEPQ